MSETKFPLAEEEDYYLAGTYEQMDVDDWFKRCLADFPDMSGASGHWVKHGDSYFLSPKFLMALIGWKIRWLSQFNKNSEECK